MMTPTEHTTTMRKLAEATAALDDLYAAVTTKSDEADALRRHVLALRRELSQLRKNVELL